MNISKKLLSILLAAAMLLSANICALAAPAQPLDDDRADVSYSGDSEKGNAPALTLLSARRPSGGAAMTAAPAPAARTVSPGHTRNLARHGGVAPAGTAKHCGKVLPDAGETSIPRETDSAARRTIIINGQEYALDVQVIDGVEYAKLSELAVVLTSAAAEL